MSHFPINTEADAYALLSLKDSELFPIANSLREENFGSTIDLCAIINARSGNCSMDCAFCSQSRYNATGVTTFPLLSAKDLRHHIETLADLPVAHIGVVTSGALLHTNELNALLDLISALPEGLKKRLCTSLGRLPEESLERLRNAGLTRFHHNLETSESFYPHICTTQRWQERAETVERVKKTGLTPCTGGLFGLGESWEDRIALALSLKARGISNIPINFLHPHAHSPLANRPLLSPDEALRIVALFRVILPDATIRICGGRPLVLGARQEELFFCGANALMIGDYLTTKGALAEKDLQMLARLHLSPSFSHVS
ncbi:MAG: biotin synthase BioB [Desulfovibrio sp.]|nr:biotin synthase BioB [Desulfovibrio sp.]